MKKIEVYMRAEKLEAVQLALAQIGITGMTVSDVKGLGSQIGHTEIYRGTEYAVTFIPKIRIDLLISDEEVTECINAITEHARTGEIGDGKIIISPVEEIISIRTGERGELSLYA